MPRYKLLLEYDGTGLVGWQRQENGPSVQQNLEEAIEQFSQQKIVVHGAGRTDSGVHALGQVAHIDLDKDFPCETVQRAINGLVEGAIAVLSVEKVTEDFQARFSAIQRHYCYRIINRRAPLALERNRAWHIPYALDHEKMAAAAVFLVGKHDFTSFRAVACQSESPVKTLSSLSIYPLPLREGEGGRENPFTEIQILASAPSFLHHMVRNIVGTLELVGAGKWQPEDVKKALESRDRAAAGPTAPAQGLYLTRVDY